MTAILSDGRTESRGDTVTCTVTESLGDLRVQLLSLQVLNDGYSGEAIL
jgi:hypothetical protein